MNGHVPQSSGPPETKTEWTSRVQDRPNISVAELAAMQRGSVERLGKLIEELTAVMNRLNPPTAAVGSTADTRETAVAELGRGITHHECLGKLTLWVLPDGSTSYVLRTDAIRSTVAKILGAARPAFIERCAATDSRERARQAYRAARRHSNKFVADTIASKAIIALAAQK